MKMQLKELFLLHFLNDGVRTSFIILLPFIAKDLSLSLTQVGFLGSSQALIAALLALPTGFLMGKFKGFHMILLLLIVYSLAAMGVSLAPNVFILICTYLLASLGFAMFHTVGFSLTAKSSTPGDVGRNMGNFTAIGDIGRITIPTAAVLISSFIGWRTTMVIIGAVGILLFFVFRLTIRSKDIYFSPNINFQNYKEFFSDIITVFRQKHAISITIVAILDSLASSPIFVYLPFLLVKKGETPFELSIVMGSFFVGSLVGKMLLGRAVDKFGNVAVFIISEICMAISIIFIAYSNQLLLILFFAIMLGVFTKGTSPVIQTMFSQISHKDHYHKVFAVSELVIGLSAVIAIVIMGNIADKVGIMWIFYLTASLAILATLPIYAFSRTKMINNLKK